MASVRLGILADIHEDLYNLKRIIPELNNDSLEGVVVNGDLSRSIKQEGIMNVLLELRRIDPPVYVMSGSHDFSREYISSVKPFVEDYGFIDLDETRKVNLQGFDLISLPGTDKNYIPAYLQNILNAVKHVDFDSMEEVGGLIENPDRTLLVSHIPPYGYADKANFIEVLEEINIDGDHFLPKGIRTPYFGHGEKFKRQYGDKIAIVQQSVGSEDITLGFLKHGLSKVVCGHIHEGGPVGVNLKTEFVDQMEWSDSLIFNPGPVEYRGFWGRYILKLDNGRPMASYQSFCIKE